MRFLTGTAGIRRRDGPSPPPDPLSIAVSATGHIRARLPGDPRGPVLTHVSPSRPGPLWPLPGQSAAR
jgi:hypothetical protein